MPLAGGSANISGVEFELWFTAYKFSETLFNENMNVKPQSICNTDAKTGNTTVVSIDDLVVEKINHFTEFYNIKSKAPNKKEWTVSALKNQNVLRDFKEQYQKSPESSIFFVSMDPCIPFSEILLRGKNCSNRDELEITLKPNNYIKQWDLLAKELGLKDNELKLLNFAKNIYFLRYLSIEEIKEKIDYRLQDYVTDSKYATLLLHELASEASIEKRTIGKKEIISFLEKKGITLKVKILDKTLLDKLYYASSNILSIQDTFFEGCSLKRDETIQIFNKILEKFQNNQNNVIVLAGEAGSGKSAIIKALFNKLQKDSIPVLALKADLMMYDSIDSIENETKLTEGIRDVIGTLAEHYETIVVLIDQIDALSQTMSKDRRSLNTYLTLISQINLIKKVRIVISCREYDLLYDSALSNFNKNKITVGYLSFDTEVKEVLIAKGIENTNLPTALKNLLITPLYLRVFCEIYDNNLDLNGLKTIQDLYDELWRIKIENQLFTDNSILQCIEQTVDYMHAHKTLSIPESLLDRQITAKHYLLSQNIFALKNKKIQYFHQTFFDYCFARLFISKGQSLEKEILGQHQGLFIRSQVKQVLTYLRDRLDDTYYKEINSLLTNTRIRYHLWLLAVNILASQQKPNDKEKNLAGYLFSNKIFCLQFINSIYNEEWLLFLIESGNLFKMMYSLDENIRNTTKWKLGMLAKDYPDIIINFLYAHRCKKKFFIETLSSVFWHLENWGNEKTINLFISHNHYFKNKVKHIYEYIVNKVLKYNPQVICKIYFKDIFSKIKEVDDKFDNKTFQYHDTEVFKKLMKWNHEIVLKKALHLVTQLITNTKWQEKKNKFYTDNAFFSYLNHDRDLYEHWKWLSIIEEYLIKLSNENKTLFLKIISKYSNTYSSTLVCLFIKCYYESTEDYTNESYKLLMKKGLVEDLRQGYYGSYEYRQLLNKIYSKLNNTQRHKLNEFIFNFSPKSDRGGSIEYLKWREYPKFELLSSIPRNEIVNYPKLFKKLQELERKFNFVYENKKPNSGGVFGVGPPLSSEAYDKMTLEHWLKSFLKYNETTGWDKPKSNHIDDPTKGGIVEHSRAFTSIVKSRPDYFYNFIFDLRKKKGVSYEYLAAGLDGLIQSNYDIIKLKKLILSNWKVKNTWFRRKVISAIEYIDRNRKVTLDLIKILEIYSTRDTDPKEEYWSKKSTSGLSYHGGNAFISGINSVRGSSAFALSKHGFHTNHSRKLFEIYDKISKDKSIAVKSCVLVNLQGMLKYDRDKTYSLLIKFTKKLQPQLIKYGLESVYHLLSKDNFNSFINIFRIGMTIDDDDYGHHPISQFVGQLLMLAYCRGYENAESLLNEGFIKNENIKIGALDFSIRYLNTSDKEYFEKTKRIFLKFLNEDSIEIKRKYGWEFHGFSVENFNKLYPLIKEYSNSKAAGFESKYYLDYLLKCCDLEPEKCLDLIDNYSKLEKPDIRYNALNGEELVKIIVGSYNKLQQENYKDKAMNILDKIMKDDHYKNEGEKLLSQIDRI